MESGSYRSASDDSGYNARASKDGLRGGFDGCVVFVRSVRPREVVIDGRLIAVVAFHSSAGVMRPSVVHGAA